MLVEKAPHDVLREIDELGAAQKHVVLELALFRAHAHPAPFVVQRRIEIAAARDRIADHLILTAPVRDEGRPGEMLALLEVAQVLGRHGGLGVTPDMLDDIEAVAQRRGRILGMAEDHDARLVRFIRGDRIGARNRVVVRRKIRHVGLVLEPVAHRLPHFGFARCFGEERAIAAVEHARQIGDRLASGAQTPSQHC